MPREVNPLVGSRAELDRQLPRHPPVRLGSPFQSRPTTTSRDQSTRPCQSSSTAISSAPIVLRFASSCSGASWPSGYHMMLVFRHFPLTELHPNAELAAEAVESTGAQGKFWAMHDMVFEKQSDLSVPALLAYVDSDGADPRVVEADLRTRVWKPRVSRDVISGARSRVTGTPTFFVDGYKYEGTWDYPTMLRVLSSLVSDS